MAQDSREVKIPRFVTHRRSVFFNCGHQVGLRNGVLTSDVYMNVFQNKKRDLIKYSGTQFLDREPGNNGMRKGWDLVYRIVVRAKAQIVSETE